MAKFDGLCLDCTLQEVSPASSMDQATSRNGAYRGLTHRERKAFDFFRASSIPALRGSKKIPVPLIWLPHAKYVFSNPTLSALGFCNTEPHGGSILFFVKPLWVLFVLVIPFADCLIQFFRPGTSDPRGPSYRPERSTHQQHAAQTRLPFYLHPHQRRRPGRQAGARHR